MKNKLNYVIKNNKMKKLMMVLAALTLTITINAQSLKGISIGVKGQKEFTATTLGGVKGVIIVQSLNDGTCYQLMFIPADNGTTPNRIFNSDAEKIIHGVELNFNIKFRKHYENEYSKDYTSLTRDGDTYYWVSVEINEYLTPSVKFALVIADERLREIAKSEEQEKANSDF